jgi:hypothetical protein
LKKCKPLGCENLKTLHLNLIQRKNRSYPTLETVPCSLSPRQDFFSNP